MSSRVVVRVAAAVAAVVGSLKFSWLFVQSGFDITVSPWGFLLVFVLPFVGVVLLAPRRPRAAAALMLPFGLATFVFMGAGIVQGEYLLEIVLVALPVAAACAIGVGAAVWTLVPRHPVVAH